MIALQFPMLIMKDAAVQPLWCFVFVATAFYLLLFIKALKFIAGLLSDV